MILVSLETVIITISSHLQYIQIYFWEKIGRLCHLFCVLEIVAC